MADNCVGVMEDAFGVCCVLVFIFYRMSFLPRELRRAKCVWEGDVSCWLRPGPEVMKLFSCSPEHEIFNAHKYKNIKKMAFFRFR